MDESNPRSQQLVQSNVTGNGTLFGELSPASSLLTDTGRSKPVGIAYDWVSDRLYWTDETYGRIISARNNGSEKLIIAASSRPRAIAVHPCKGFVRAVSFEIDHTRLRFFHADYCSGQILVSIHPSVARRSPDDK